MNNPHERRKIPSLLADSPLTSGSHDAHGGKSFEYSPVAMMPDVRVFKVGGQSIMDRGRAAVFPILDELVAAKDKHKLLLCCGGGTRARHVYAMASDLELPTGLLAALGGYVPRQNARMLQMLLARHGGTAEVLGCKRAIFIKDEAGLFDDDPKKNKNAKHIPRVTAQELIDSDLPDMVVERVVIKYLLRSRFCTELQIINGLERGMITRALEGEDVGTLITKA